MVKAVIFDMDGVIVDTEYLHFLAWKILFEKEKGIKLKKSYFKDMVGTTDLFTAKYFFKKYKIRANAGKWRLKKRRIVIRLYRERTKIFPGAKQTIRKLSKKYKIGLATSSSRIETNIVMKRFSLKQFISKIIVSEDIRNHKPHPQIYQRMAKKLKIKEKECVVIEDSLPGIISAKKAGCKCIAVSTTLPAKKLKKADLIVRDLRSKRMLTFIKSF